MQFPSSGHRNLRCPSRGRLSSLITVFIASVLVMGAGLAAADSHVAGEAADANSKKMDKEKAAPSRVSIETTLGTIIIELNPEEAPKTVANFLQYVESGAYDGTIFHRVISNFMIQGGGFDKDLKKRPTRPGVENEADNALKNDRGTVAMARTGNPHSATNQFFINVKMNASLNHRGKTPRGWGYTVFAKVVEGMKVVNAIKLVRTGDCGPLKDCPLEMVEMVKVELLESKPEAAP